MNVSLTQIGVTQYVTRIQRQRNHKIKANHQ